MSTADLTPEQLNILQSIENNYDLFFAKSAMVFLLKNAGYDVNDIETSNGTIYIYALKYIEINRGLNYSEVDLMFRDDTMYSCANDRERTCDAKRVISNDGIDFTANICSLDSYKEVKSALESFLSKIAKP